MSGSTTVEADHEQDPGHEERYHGADRRQEQDAEVPPTEDGSQAGEEDRGWPRVSRSTQVILITAAVVVVLSLAAIAVGSLPLWWARRVSSVANGARGLGTVLGIMTGFVFTVAPMFVLRQVMQRHRTWKNRSWLLVVAAAVGFPNLLTLGMMLGDYGHAAQAREVVDLGAPGFRGATLVGVITGVAGVFALWWLWSSRASRGRRIVELEYELRRTAPAESSGKRGKGTKRG